MSLKFNVWIDSGANDVSVNSKIISLEEIGYTDKFWERLSNEEKDDIMREVAFDQAEWGYEEL